MKVLTFSFASSALAEPAKEPNGSSATLKESTDVDSERRSETDYPNRIYFRGGIDPSLGITAGYARGFEFVDTARDLYIFGEFSTAFATFGRNGAVTIGTWLPILRAGYFRLSAEAGFDMGWTHNRNYNSMRLAPKLTTLIGVGKPNELWYIDGVFGYGRAIANHIDHTEFYRNVFYEDAVDGWYYGTSGFFRMGLRTGARMGRWDLEFRVTHVRTEKLKNTLGSPLTATVGVGVRL